MPLFLSQLEPNDEATIIQLPDDQRIASRLREMGLLRGTKIIFIRRAPLGDPLEIRLRGYSLSLRACDASAVLVEKISK